MRALLLLAGLLLAGCSGPAETTTSTTPTETVILLHGGEAPRFEPGEATVKVGDTVLFRVASGRHTVDFDASKGLSNPHSGEIGVQTPFAVRFTEAGTYPFSCSLHEGMAGTVTVQ